MSGQLEKLIITSYKSVALDESEKDLEYVVLVNPDQIVQDNKVLYETSAADGQSSETRHFRGVSSPKLTLKLLFDGTGVLPSPKLTSFAANAFSLVAEDNKKLSEVNKQIEAFKKTVLSYRGDNHQTPNIKVVWGEFIFKGLLDSFKITYTLFTPDGKPLRAVGDASFVENIDAITRTNTDNNSSPDLTHIRTVSEGDTLPIMCNRIYRNPKLYLKIAKINGLSNYRNLEVGSKLFFPPLKNEN